MKKRRLTTVLLSTVMVFNLLSGVCAAESRNSIENAVSDEDSDEYVEGEAIICIGESDSLEVLGKNDDYEMQELMDVSDALEDLDTNEIKTQSVKDAHLKLVHSDKLNTKELIERLENDSDVVFAEPNYIVSLDDEDTDTDIEEDEERKVEDVDLTGLQYAYGKDVIDLPGWNAKNSEKNSRGVVAVVDTGIDYTNTDLQNVMWDEGEKYPELVALGGGKYGCCFIERNSKGFLYDSDDPMDDNQHGTHCAGIIAGEWNGVGVSGTANGCKLMAVKGLNDKGSGANSWLINGLNYVFEAKKCGVDVVAVNCSFGGPLDNLGYQIITNKLSKEGIVVCWASGNDNLNADYHNYDLSLYGGIDGCIVVDSCDFERYPSTFTNYGRRTTDVFAPGTDILSTIPVDCSAGNFVSEYVELDDFETEEGFEFEDGGGDVEADIKVVQSENMRAFFGENYVLKVSEVKCDKEGSVTSIKMKTKLTEDACRLVFNSKCDSDNTDAKIAVNVSVNGEDTVVDQVNNTSCCSRWQTNIFDMSECDISGEKEIIISFYDKTAVGENRDGVSTPVYLDDIYFTNYKDSEYAYLSGTSMATPMVTGMVSIAAKYFPDDSAGKRAARIIGSVKRSDDLKDLCRSDGLVNARNMIDGKYYPVVNRTGYDSRGKLHIYGYFFGDTKGKITIDGKEYEVYKWTDEDITLNNTSSMTAGEKEIKVISNVGSGTRWTHVDAKDNIGSDLYGRLPLPSDETMREKLKRCNMIATGEYKGNIYFLGFYKKNDTITIWEYTPIDDNNGSWSIVDEDIEWDEGDLTRTDKKLLFDNDRILYATRSTWLSISINGNDDIYEEFYKMGLDNLVDIIETDIAKVGDDIYLFATATDENKEKIYTYLYKFDADKEEFTEVRKLDRARAESNVVVRGSDMYVLFGNNEGLYEPTYNKWEFTDFNANIQKIAVKENDLDFSIIPAGKEVYEVDNLDNAGFVNAADGIYMFGAVSINGTLDEGNEKIIADNFIWNPDKATEKADFTACSRKISNTMLQNSFGVECGGAAYFYGLTNSASDKIIFASTKADCGNGNGWNSGREVNIYKSKSYSRSGLPYTVNLTGAVTYNGKKHGVGGIGKTKKAIASDLTLSIPGIDADGFEIKSVRVRNGKNANCSPDGTAIASAKQPELVIKLKGKGKLTAEKKQLLKKYNNILKKEPIPFNITQIDLSDSETGNISTFELNKKGTKAKKIVYTTSDKTDIKLSKKDYELSSDGKTITGKRNYAGTYVK